MQKRKRRKSRHRDGYVRPDRRGRSSSVQCEHCLQVFAAQGLARHQRGCAQRQGGGSSALGDPVADDHDLQDMFGLLPGDGDDDDDDDYDADAVLLADHGEDDNDGSDGKIPQRLAFTTSYRKTLRKHLDPLYPAYLPMPLRSYRSRKRWR